MQVNTWLRKQVNQSPLTSQAIVRPKGSTTKRVLVSSLLLTSLVDAFSILVIFLLMSASNQIETVELSDGNRLPIASDVESLNKGVILKIQDGTYKIGDTLATLETMGAILAAEKRKMSAELGRENVPLIIQADKEVAYQTLSPVLRASSEQGFHQYSLAVLDESAR